MKRRLFNLLAAVSVVMCVLIVLMWMASYRWRFGADFRSGNGRAVVVSAARGSLWCTRAYHDGPRAGRFEHSFWTVEQEPISPTGPAEQAMRQFVRFNHLGFYWSHIEQPAQTVRNADGSSYSFTHGGLTSVGVPLWSLLVVVLLLPTAALWRRRRFAWRVRNHLCPACGYDLRATPDRCPECGTVPAQQPAEAKA